jgi:hypothetical protein
MTRRTKRPESGLDKFLKERMAEDKQFRALFLAEAAKLTAGTVKRSPSKRTIPRRFSTRKSI